ncbi:MAG: glycosyltransferase family 39 protein [Dehalococcoidia bacterium]|nr:glycosyltransferase family 39 protein [Dehalococcoidia bacterium]
MKTLGDNRRQRIAKFLGTQRLLLAICLVSLLVRMAFPLFLEARASGIAAEHAITAYSLVTGHGFHWDRGWYERVAALQQEQKRLIDLQALSAPTNLALSEPSTDYPPGYPLLLAATFKITGQARYIYLQVIALVVDAVVVPVLLYFLGSRLFNRRVGLTAAALYAIWLSFAYIAFEPRPEGLLPSVSLGLLVGLYLFLRQGRWRWLALMAVLIAIGVNLRSDMLSTIPFMALAVVVAGKGPFKLRVLKCVAIGAVLGAVALTALVPYGLIQRERFGEFRFTTPALGVAAWQGIGEYPNRWGAVLSDVHMAEMLASHGLESNTPAGERFLLAKVKDAFLGDPVWFLGSFAKRAQRIVLMQYNWGVPQAVKNALDVPGERVSAHCQTWSVLPGGSVTCWGLALAYIGTARSLILLDWSLWIGAIVGVIIFRKRPYVWLLLVLPLARLIPFSFIHVEPRYILYGMGPSLVFLAALLVSGWQSSAKVLAVAWLAWSRRRRLTRDIR